jgi:hypothetical protein
MNCTDKCSECGLAKDFDLSMQTPNSACYQCLEKYRISYHFHPDFEEAKIEKKTSRLDAILEPACSDSSFWLS